MDLTIRGIERCPGRGRGRLLRMLARLARVDAGIDLLPLIGAGADVSGRGDRNCRRRHGDVGGEWRDALKGAPDLAEGRNSPAINTRRGCRAGEEAAAQGSRPIVSQLAAVELEPADKNLSGCYATAY